LNSNILSSKHLNSKRPSLCTNEERETNVEENENKTEEELELELQEKGIESPVLDKSLKKI
jgi:hypothetical protein